MTGFAMTRNLISFAAVAIVASITLNACRNEPEKVGGPADPQREALAKAPPVKELPPSIQDSRTYRCADNSLVYVDFYTNNTAQLRTSETGQPTMLRAEGGNPPYRAEGYSVAGNAARTSVTVPGRGTQSCHE
jgi:hypothetical protein